MIKLISIMFALISTIFYAGLLVCVLFLLLCMNVFTVPIIIIRAIVNKALNRKQPKLHLYGLMLYSSGKDNVVTLTDHLKMIEKRRQKKINKKLKNAWWNFPWYWY